MKNNIKFFLSILIAGSLWGTTGIFTRNLFPLGINGIRLTFARCILASVIVFIIIIFKDKSLLKIKLRDLWLFFGSGVCSFLFFSFCYMNSISQNSLSAAAILLYTAPVFIALISIPVFKEKLDIKGILALILAISGCILVAYNGDIKITSAGLIYGLGSGLGYALYSIFGRLSIRKYSSLTTTFYTFLFGTVGSIFFVDIKTTYSCLQNPKALVLTVSCAIVTTILPYLFYTYGLTGVKASAASIIATIEPVVASILGFAVFGETLGVLGIIGIAVVVVAIIILNTESFSLKKQI